MSLDRKQAILDILANADIPLIEDDIYGDLAFSGERPEPMASINTNADIIYCSSFSKTLAPGFRVGWMHSNRFSESLSHLKFSQSLGVAPIEQIALDAYLRAGHYPRHVRQLQRRFYYQVENTSEFIRRYFPSGTQISKAKGGFVVWITLDRHFDSYAFYQKALDLGISIAPGRVFSMSNEYSNCFRLNCAQPWDALEPALKTLAKLIHKNS